MVVEMRRIRLELDNQRHFTKEGKPIETAREYIDRWTIGRPSLDAETVASKTAENMRRAAANNLFEMG